MLKHFNASLAKHQDVEKDQNSIQLRYFLGYLKTWQQGLVVNVNGSQSDPWSLDVSSIRGSPKNYMDKMDNLMAENNENNKDSQKGQVTSKKYLKKTWQHT